MTDEIVIPSGEGPDEPDPELADAIPGDEIAGDEEEDPE